MRNKLLIGLLVVIAVFLVGFLPQYLELRSVRAELVTVKQANSLAEIRDLAGYLMLETSQKNYGIASGYATRFFERARQVHDESTDPEIRQTLEDVLAARDQVTGALAQGDPAVLAAVQDIFRKVQSKARLQRAA
jgi:hypothetical protein